MKLESLAIVDATLKVWLENLRNRGWSDEDIAWLEVEARKTLNAEIAKEVKDWN